MSLNAAFLFLDVDSLSLTDEVVDDVSSSQANRAQPMITPDRRKGGRRLERHASDTIL